MRYDEGYKLHVGALSPSYVETAMSNATFDSILSGIYTETCDEVKRGLRLHRESCMKLDLTRQGGASDVPSAQQALHPGGQGSPRRHRSQQSSGSLVQRENCASGGGNGGMDVLNCRFAEVEVDLCPCDNIIPYETVVCKGEGGFSTALVW